MYYVYIQYSDIDNKFHIGFTNNLEARIKQHKAGKVKSTSKRLGLRLIYYEAYLNKKDAMRNEKYYKTSKGKKDLRKRLQDFLGL